eukprot:scaffold18369_cov111-Isochrysis_galbana.AAC.4
MLRSLYRCAMASTATSPPDWQKTCCIWTERGMVEVSPLWYGSSSRSCGGSSSEAEWCTTSSSRAGTTWPYEEEPRTATPPPVAAAARLPRLYGSELWCCRRPIVCAPVRAAAPPAASDAACSPERRPASHAPGEALRSPSPPPAPATGGWTVMQLLTLPRLSRTVGAVWSCRHCPSTMNLYWWLPGCRLTVWAERGGRGRGVRSERGLSRGMRPGRRATPARRAARRWGVATPTTARAGGPCTTRRPSRSAATASASFATA